MPRAGSGCRVRSDGPREGDARQGVAGWLVCSHPGIYGAALERESLTEIYRPAYLLGVGPPDESEQPLSQQTRGRSTAPRLAQSLSCSTANNRLARRVRARPTWSLCNNNARWLRSAAQMSVPQLLGGQLAAIRGGPMCLDMISCPLPTANPAMHPTQNSRPRGETWDSCIKAPCERQAHATRHLSPRPSL